MIFLPIPATVPPVPAPQTIMSNLPSHCVKISVAVPARLRRKGERTKKEKEGWRGSGRRRNRKGAGNEESKGGRDIGRVGERESRGK